MFKVLPIKIFWIYHRRSLKMATERTPAHKRIVRAEQGRDDWKIKAIERHEEAMRLRFNLESRDAQVVAQQELIQDLRQQLADSNKVVSNLIREVESLKKSIL